jgi:hypothetical protein
MHREANTNRPKQLELWLVAEAPAALVPRLLATCRSGNAQIMSCPETKRVGAELRRSGRIHTRRVTVAAERTRIERTLLT